MIRISARPTLIFSLGIIPRVSLDYAGFALSICVFPLSPFLLRPKHAAPTASRRTGVFPRQADCRKTLVFSPFPPLVFFAVWVPTCFDLCNSGSHPLSHLLSLGIIPCCAPLLCSRTIR